jgi:hypothetical protein
MGHLEVMAYKWRTSLGNYMRVDVYMQTEQEDE